MPAKPKNDGRMAEKHSGTQFFKEKVVQDLKNELEVVGNRVTNEELRPHIGKWRGWPSTWRVA